MHGGVLFYELGVKGRFQVWVKMSCFSLARIKCASKPLNRLEEDIHHVMSEVHIFKVTEAVGHAFLEYSG